MKEPYAKSTLSRKYRETGIPKDSITAVQVCLRACANLYGIIEIDDAWRVIRSYCGMDRAAFDRLLPIMSRDGKMPFYLERESEFYGDGTDQLLLIGKSLIYILNEDCTDDDVVEYFCSIETGEEYTGPDLLIPDWGRFYELNKQRTGKPLYIPKDLLPYIDEEYHEETPQVRGMLRFLTGKIDEPEDALSDMIDIINDVSIPMSQTIQAAMDATGYEPRSTKEMDDFARLFTDLSNNTRMWSNKGHTPNELTEPGLPRKFIFGPGMQEAIRSGDPEREKLIRAFSGEDLPSELRADLISEVDRALKPGEERWVGGTLYKGPKVGPNDPCPCGSGKKYKKCCGRMA